MFQVEPCFTALVNLVPGGITVEVRVVQQWHRALGLAGLAVTALFVVALALVLVTSGGQQGHAMPAGGHVQAGHQPDQTVGAGSHGGPFLQSFAFASLAASVLFVVGVVAWASFRRRWEFAARHVVVCAAALALVGLYLLARGSLAYDGHNWNRSFGDASVVLFAATLAIGPLAKLWRPAAHALAWRRETGIWATIAAGIHVGIFWEWSLAWDWRRFFYPGLHGGAATTLMGSDSVPPSAFNLANVVGVVALAYAVVLALTSNDLSQRLLNSGWSWLMRRATTMQLLVLLHTWLFAYYVTREQALPAGTLWASFLFVLVLQSLAFAKTSWLRPRAATA
jgi:methionine sulfoxide reductase heme-binding subunit